MAAFTPSVPFSSVLRSKTTASDNEPRRQTKQEFRKEKELEEGRKAGTVPAMTDVESGRDINPHIPHYISNVPWYVGSSGPTLKHQRPHPERQSELSRIVDTYKRGVTNQRATKYREGACENCGAMGHKRKECFERPRKVGAKYSNQDIAPDDFTQEELKLSYDAKRDRWSGFDPSDYSKVVEEFKSVEDARKIIKSGKLDEDVQKGQMKDDDAEEYREEEEDSQDEDKYAEGADMPGVKIDHDSSTRITVRNLRIREDTAKYLYNLDPDSAYYDPKSRAMREDPFKNLPAEKRPSNVAFMGDNFQRYTGEVREADQGQVFAWDAQSKGLDVHALAEPTKLEALRKEFEEKKKNIKSTVKSAILEKYGGEEHLLDEDTKRLIFNSQTETYTEYTRKGELIKGQEKPVVKSRYEEDFYPNNHTSIFGSYWSNGKWGYKCCRSFVKNSYCVGDLGSEKGGEVGVRTSAKSARNVSETGSESAPSDRDEECTDARQESAKKRTDRKRRRRAKKRENERKSGRRAKKPKKKEESDSSSTDSTESGSEPDPEPESEPSTTKSDSEPLRRTLLKRAALEKRDRPTRNLDDDRLRPYNSMKEVEPLSEADIEVYKLRKLHAEDPMASYFDK